MPDEIRIQELLDNLESHQTPEDVCGNDAELLREVRARWEKMRRVNNQVDDLFPADAPTLKEGFASLQGTLELPQIEGYDVESVLGRGGMGVVFKAKHRKLNRFVAVKMMLSGPFAGPVELARFQREVEAVAALRHPNIVQIHDVGDQAGRHYFTMEYVEGGSLAQKLAGKPQPATESAEMIATLACAVQFAHQSGFIHRDLKPANILLTADDIPKITDFGLARSIDAGPEFTLSGARVGTPSYMAPEQALGKAHAIGPAVDVYALGAVLYEMLTGRPPFEGESAAATERQVIADEPVPPSRLNPKVPRDLETVCLKCLQKDPQRRYTSAAALAEDLQRYLLGQVVTARPVSQFERAVKWIRRNKWIASLSAAAVFALVMGTVASLLFGFEANRQEGLATDRAGKLEEKMRELQAQKREIEAQKRDTERVAVAGFLTTIGRNPPLLGIFDVAEADALRQLRATPRHLRLQFLETALRDPKTARRVGHRADCVIQALVGCDRALRADVRELIVRRIQEPAVSQEVKLACARLGVALNIDDRAWAARSAEALCVALREPPPPVLRDDSIALAEALAAACEHLPKARAAEHGARVIDFFVARLQKPLGVSLHYNHLGPAIEALTPHLDAVAAKRAAQEIESIIRQSESSPQSWDTLARTLLALCRRLPPSDSTAHVNGMVDFVFQTLSTTKEEKKWYHYPAHTKTLATLSGQLDPAGAARVADKIVTILGGTMSGGRPDEFVTHYSISNDLGSVVGRLDAPGSLRAAEALIPVLKKAEKLHLNVEVLRTVLFSMCRRLDAAGSARVADAIAVAVQDPKTPMLARSLLASAFEVVGDRLDRGKAAALESAMVDSLIADLADAKSRNFRGLMVKALGSVGGRPGAKSASRTAEALSAVIGDPQTPIVSLKPLAAALAMVSDQLAPADASSHAKKAIGVFDSLWIARTTPSDRASLAEAMAAVWTRLGPHEKAAHSKRVAAGLEDALRDAKTEPNELSHLADALTAVCGQLEPAARVGHARSAVEILVAKLQPKNEVPPSPFVPLGLAGLCVHLDRHEIAGLADIVFTVLSEADVRLNRIDVHAAMFKKIVAQMDERDLERLLEHPWCADVLQRNLLDILGESRHRYFRNTWDYLDWSKSNGNRTANEK
jgi:hypothetical protein